MRLRHPIRAAFVLAATLGLWSSVAMAAEGGHEAPSMFGDFGQAIVTIFIFIVLVFVLGRWAWKPLVSQMEKREKDIAQTIEDSQKRQKEAEALLAKYKAHLDTAQSQAAELLAQARREAAEARDKVLSLAQEDSHRLTEEARTEIERAKNEAMGDLYAATAQLAADVAASVIHKRLTPDDQKRLVSDSLEEIRKRALR